MAEPLFTGVGAALVTLFDEDGAVDVDGMVGHAEQLVTAGVQAVLVAGTTGESETLDDGERGELVAAVRARLDPAVTVIGGASGSFPRDAAQRAAAVRRAGADAVLTAPARGGVELQPYFDAVVEAVGESSRVFGYHNPGPLGVPGIAVEALGDLPIGGVKDSSGDPSRLLHELDTWDGNVYVGNPTLLALAGPVGAVGALLALANSVPETCIAAFAGDTTAQRELIAPHLEVRRRGLPALKEATAKRFGLSATSRLSLT